MKIGEVRYNAGDGKTGAIKITDDGFEVAALHDGRYAVPGKFRFEKSTHVHNWVLTGAADGPGEMKSWPKELGRVDGSVAQRARRGEYLRDEIPGKEATEWRCE